MVKRNTPDWQISAFDKDNNSCVKTKPFNEKIKDCLLYTSDAADE